MRGAASPLSPLLLAASRAQTWVEVLRSYTQCRAYLQRTYRPTTAELHYGLSRMEGMWALSLFYYDFIKSPVSSSSTSTSSSVSATAVPDASLVVAMLQRCKETNFYKGLSRIVEEDVNSATLEGAKSKVALAAYTGMWETALVTLMQHAKLRQSYPLRRTVLTTLSLHNQWQRALQLIRLHPPMELRPFVVRPVVRCFGRLRHGDMALRLTAASLATGYPFNATLLSALLTTLQDTNQWSAALEAAQELQLFSATRTEVRKNTVLFNQLVNCLYEADVYSDYTLQEVVQGVLERINPRDATEVVKDPKAKPFRLRQHADVFQQFQGVLLPLSQLFSKLIRIPRWYSRSLRSIIDIAFAENSTVIVMDTNFLIHLVQKNLTPEHFYGYMKQRYPDVQSCNFATIVVPFTVLQETHTQIWAGKTRYPLATRVLLWSRVLAIVGQTNVYALSLAGEFPCIALSVLTKLAYSAMPENVAGSFEHDPDLRILNVCLTLQHYFREATAAENLGGVRPVEGTALFGLLKYHVRRHCNAVKGTSTSRLLLCTMDRRMTQAARQLGIRVFPMTTDAI